MSIESSMNTTALVTYSRVSGDSVGSGAGAGGPADPNNRVTRYAAMPVRIQAVSGNLRALYNRERVEVTHRAFFPMSYNLVQEWDWIVALNPGKAAPTTYEVRFVDDMDGHHFEAMLRELRGPVGVNG